MKRARLRLPARSICARPGAALRLAWLALAVGAAARLALAQAPVLEPAPPGSRGGGALAPRRRGVSRASAPTWRPCSRSASTGGIHQSTSGSAPGRSAAAGAASCACSRRPREAGTGLLRLPPNLWRYAPLTASIESLAAARLREPWLGSDFTLADLLDPPAGLGTAPARLLGVDAASGSARRRSAPSCSSSARAATRAAGRVIAWIGTERATPLRCDRRDAQDALVSSLRFDDVREVEGRPVPHRWTLTRPAAPQRESRIELREIRFDPAFDDAIFTTRQLLQRGVTPAAAAAPDARLGAPGGSPP